MDVKQNIRRNYPYIVESLGANPKALEKLLGILFAARVLSEHIYKQLLGHSTHSYSRQITNIRRLLHWIIHYPDEEFYVFCHALKRIGLEAELDLLLPTSKETLEQDSKALGAETAAVMN